MQEVHVGIITIRTMSFKNVPVVIVNVCMAVEILTSKLHRMAVVALVRILALQNAWEIAYPGRVFSERNKLKSLKQTNGNLEKPLKRRAKNRGKGLKGKNRD